MDGDIHELRRAPSAIATLGITEIVAHYEQIIRSLDTAPFIIGHSFGGLITQILLDRGLGSAGVDGELINYAAIGVWYKPRQCFRQRYESKPIDTGSSTADSGRRPSSPECVRWPL
jgi:pimeloyl-ACP methyl ester carboxylesterase